MAFIEPMHRNKPNITYLLTSDWLKNELSAELQYGDVNTGGLRRSGRRCCRAVSALRPRAWTGVLGRCDQYRVKWLSCRRWWMRKWRNLLMSCGPQAVSGEALKSGVQGVSATNFHELTSCKITGFNCSSSGSGSSVVVNEKPKKKGTRITPHPAWWHAETFSSRTVGVLHQDATGNYN